MSTFWVLPGMWTSREGVMAVMIPAGITVVMAGLSSPRMTSALDRPPTCSYAGPASAFAQDTSGERRRTPLADARRYETHHHRR